MNENARAPKWCKTRRQLKLVADGRGWPECQRYASELANTTAAKSDDAETPREFRNLSKDDYRKSNHLLASIAGFADLLATL